MFENLTLNLNLFSFYIYLLQNVSYIKMNSARWQNNRPTSTTGLDLTSGGGWVEILTLFP